MSATLIANMTTVERNSMNIKRNPVHGFISIYCDDVCNAMELSDSFLGGKRLVNLSLQEGVRVQVVANNVQELRNFGIEINKLCEDWEWRDTQDETS